MDDTYSVFEFQIRIPLARGYELSESEKAQIQQTVAMSAETATRRVLRARER